MPGDAARCGRATLSFRYVGGRTVLAAQHCTAPLAVQRTLVGGVGAQVALLNVGGGLVGGDRVAIEVAVAERATAQIVTVGATRVYRATTTAPTQTSLHARVGAGGLFVYLPDETIPYAGALYESRTSLDLADEGAAIVGEVIGPGRLHRGERFAYRSLTLTFAADRAGQPLLRERLILEPTSTRIASLALLGEHTHLATLYLCGVSEPQRLVDTLYGLLDECGVYGGATVAAPRAVLLRAVGGSAYPLRQLVQRAAACGRAYLATVAEAMTEPSRPLAPAGSPTATVTGRDSTGDPLRYVKKG